MNPYGDGEFCKFCIHVSKGMSGVYILTIGVDNKVKYIGEYVDLLSRFNNGYGTISPRNCYEGGQPTNCRINKKILESIQSGQKVKLWYHPAKDERKKIEASLIQNLKPEWN